MNRRITSGSILCLILTLGTEWCLGKLFWHYVEMLRRDGWSYRIRSIWKGRTDENRRHGMARANWARASWSEMIIKNRGRERHPHKFIGLYLLTHKAHCANNFLVIVWVGICPGKWLVPRWLRASVLNSTHVSSLWIKRLAMSTEGHILWSYRGLINSIFVCGLRSPATTYQCLWKAVPLRMTSSDSWAT